MSTYIKVYRGNQIGGCVTEIRTEKTKLIIDFGENLPGNESMEELQLEGLTCGQADVAAVFFTHYHGDHMGRLKEILPSIPLYMGTATRRVLQTISDTIRNEKLSALLKDDSHIKEFEQGLTYQIGDIKVTPYSVDHSAYDAHMFLVETPDKVILHTGDYRLHGYRGGKMIEVIEKLVKKNGKRKVDVLITEGTMMSRGSEKYYTEADMQKEMVEYFKDNRYVFVICSSTNLDTLATFYQAAKKNHIRTYSNPYVVEQLNNFTETAGKRAPSGIYTFEDVYPVHFDCKLPPKNGWEGTQEDLMRKYGFLIFITKGNEDYAKWIERFADKNPKVIYSMWEGYKTKGNKAFNQELYDFCEKYRAESKHTSGHAYAKDIAKVISSVNPTKAIIPIHTENKQGFMELEIAQELKEKLWMEDEWNGEGC